MTVTLKKLTSTVLVLIAFLILWRIYNLYPASSSHDEVYAFFHQKNCIGNVCENVGVAAPARGGEGLVADNGSFFLNGKPFRILSGSFHYFRTHPQQWSDRLWKMRAAGLNTVTIYVPWNLHERIPGNYEFTGFFNLQNFIELVHEVELLLIVRPGPYICAEWEFGGLPSWLLRDPYMSVRTSKSQPYLKHVKAYFDRLLPLLAKYTYKNLGPIVAFQIENEFGSYGHDLKYMQFLKTLYEQHGLNELYFTSDGGRDLSNGSIPGVLAAVNFNFNPLQSLTDLKNFQPGKPLMVAEFWPGWFDQWGKIHHRMHANDFTQKVDTILSKNASVNFYMFVGGTNFGFWNGANSGDLRNLATVTSYDYDALISEHGDIHPKKYEAFRNLLLKHHLISLPLPPVPQNSPKVAPGKFSIKETMNLEDLIKLLPNQPIVLENPTFMEYLGVNESSGQSFGWILYRTTFKFGRSLRLLGTLQDRGQIFVNGELLKIFHSNEKTVLDEVLQLNLSLKEQNVLDVLVENMGRVNYQTFNNERRGFYGKFELDYKILSPWQHYSLDFSDNFTVEIRKSAFWQSFNIKPTPALYRTYVTIHNVEDTFLDMRLWTKGIVLVNGFNVGRYWSIGPQQTLYIPKPLLVQGRNEIIVFELEKPSEKVSFISSPILDSLVESNE